MRIKKINIWTIIVCLGFILIDFFPEYGSPHFRYNGSNPDNLVWNLGKPLALFVFDSDNYPYLFLSPLAYVVIPIQILFMVIVLLIRKFLKNKDLS